MKLNKLAPLLIVGIGGLLYLFFNRSDNNTLKATDTMDVNKNLSKAIIGFYNVENLFDIYDDPKTFDDDFTPQGKQQWDTERYELKLKQIGEMISEFSTNDFPAVMGFSEVENYDVLEDLIQTDRLKNAGYQIIHKDNHDGRGIDVAAIYRPEAFAVEKYTFYPVILPGKKKATTRDILEIKGSFSNGESAVLYFTHWSSRRAGTYETEPKRIATAKELREKVDLVLAKNESANIFILGDFNDEPSNNSVKKHLVKDEFTNLSKQYEHTENGTINHQGDWLVFDQVIVSNAAMRNPVFKLTEKSAKIHKTEENTFTHRDGNQAPSRTYGGTKYYGGYSDHYPVYLTLSLKNPS